MQTLNYWTQFEHTGRVEDYLAYVSRESSDAERTTGVQAQAGDNPYAGIHMGNRNDIKADAYRGI